MPASRALDSSLEYFCSAHYVLSIDGNNDPVYDKVEKKFLRNGGIFFTGSLLSIHFNRKRLALDVKDNGSASLPWPSSHNRLRVLLLSIHEPPALHGDLGHMLAILTGGTWQILVFLVLIVLRGMCSVDVTAVTRITRATSQLSGVGPISLTGLQFIFDQCGKFSAMQHLQDKSSREPQCVDSGSDFSLQHEMCGSRRDQFNRNLKYPKPHSGRSIYVDIGHQVSVLEGETCKRGSPLYKSGICAQHFCYADAKCHDTFAG